jgi:putative membrane protein
MSNSLIIALSSSVLLMVAPSVASAAQSDKEFMEHAIEGNNSEIQLGELAQEKGATTESKNYGKTLKEDHSTANEKAIAIAKSMGVTPPTAMTAEARSEKQKLEKLSGNAFDREFANYMVKDHKKDIQDFEAQAKASGQVANFAQENLPTLKKHLDIAQSLANANSAQQ